MTGRLRWRSRAALVALALVVGGCSDKPSSGREAGAATPGRAAEPSGTPVRVAMVERATLTAEVSAPGRTVALVEHQVRAPFDGTLTALAVVEGDRVSRGQRVGEIVARDSEAALQGAREMIRQAQSPLERADAERALELARENRVAAPLLSTVAGRVTARSAAAGDRVTADQQLVTIAAGDSLIFRADLPQAELAAVRPGQSAAVELAGSPPMPARVHGLLTPDQNTDLTVPVRLDFSARPAPAVGLYGTVRIVVGERRDTPVVPLAAVLRDDVSGTARVATVDRRRRLHWLSVTTGLEDAERIEIVAPPLAAGTRVVVSRQVGLAEGAPLAIEP